VECSAEPPHPARTIAMPTRERKRVFIHGL
jgi:hypothetical protein